MNLLIRQLGGSKAGMMSWLADVPATAAKHPRNKVLHLLLSFGLVGLFFVSIVDSSFVPLPVPGMTDIMIILFAAQKTNVILLVLVATVGSAIGGYVSYQVGHSGGMAFIEKRTPPRIFKRVTGWMEHHAILAVALPAMLPPPMPLSPFVLAAGALNMSKRKFMITFTSSRFVRHAAAAWLGVIYGKPVLHFWREFSTKWGTTILIVVWTGIAISVGFAMWQLWKAKKDVGATVGPRRVSRGKPAAAA